jgi:ADP-dependent NAD(P)H-hydrate dehydratase / NAD(P)H-hydrate epimerase
MKILSESQIKQADAYTILKEPINSIDLMERAALGCVKWLTNRYNNTQDITVFCGVGNNGGDGIAIARMLIERQYSVKTFIVHYSSNFTADFIVNRERLKNLTTIYDIHQESDIQVTLYNTVVIDALFGVGINRPIEGLCAKVIQHINASKCKIISIDLPSGLPVDEHSKGNAKNIIQANHTLTFEQPKFALLLPQNSSFVGEWSLIPIQLHPQFIEQVSTNLYYSVAKDIQEKLKKRTKFSHKGSFGHALICAGSYGKMGAAVLSTSSCLRSGVGLVTAFIPKCGYTILQQTCPEAMVITDNNELEVASLNEKVDLNLYSTIGVGPGIGTSLETQTFLKQLIENNHKPMVLDADALNCIAQDDNLLQKLPKSSILTPHPKEFLRLIKATDTLSDYDKLAAQSAFSKKYQCIVVLKGAHTSISKPDGSLYFNSTGNAGMATGGSGDVLTGIITGLLAQGYTPFDAAQIGVYVHGLAGDLAAKQLGQQALIASDITNYLGSAFLELEKC